MDVFNNLRALENKFYADLSSAVPAEKTPLEHRGMRFVFYTPKPETVARYLEAARVPHADLAVLGKLHLGGHKLLLVYMDLSYYGLSILGDIYLLGSSIANLSLCRRKVYAYSSPGTE
ncbi:hypothetical protein EMCLV134R [Equine molluscum contagiosum-like virus]|nr:hypothetical protein EMCLV134R [Equine molluscum contagiosum-like virus]